MTDIIKPGKYVSLTYEIRDETDSLVEQNDIPTGYIFGSDTELLGGMDELLLGKQVGDELSRTISPENGFGEYNPEMVFVDELANVPEEFPLPFFYKFFIINPL